MSDLMTWLYQSYIQPQIESRPKDTGEEMQFDFLNNELDPQQKEAFETVLAFYGAQGFRLGLKTGMALEDELR